jgi:hypothetical protein
MNRASIQGIQLTAHLFKNQWWTIPHAIKTLYCTVPFRAALGRYKRANSQAVPPAQQPKPPLLPSNPNLPFHPAIQPPLLHFHSTG